MLARFHLALGLLLIVPAIGRGQAVAPPPPTEPAPLPPGAVQSNAPVAAADLDDLTHRLSSRIHDLGEDIAADLGQTPNGQHLIQVTEELSQALDEFRASLKAGPSGPQIRQSYSGIDASWHNLRAQIAQTGDAASALNRDASRGDQIDRQIHQAMGLNALPTDYYTANAPPSGIDQTRRLARSLVDRAEALSGAIASTMAANAELVADSAALAREADGWNDALAANTTIPAAARSFGPVDAIADRIEAVVTSKAVPAPVRAAWDAFASVEVLLHQNLGLSSPQPAVAVIPPGVNVTPTGVSVNVPGANLVVGDPTPAVVAAPAPAPTVTIAALADQLVEQTTAFVNVFGPTAGAVPQGAFFLADARRLQADAVNFRQQVAQGLDANTLAFQFRDVDATWGRMARRINRIARGRTGPNIQQVSKIGATCGQIHQALGLPGYAPVVGPF